MDLAGAPRRWVRGPDSQPGSLFGSAPSCCIRLSRSSAIHSSQILPSTMRHANTPATATRRFVAVEPDAGMAVFVVVPAEEASAESATIFNGAETVRELWSVCKGLELRL
jgi:hypothetical protein